MKNQAKTEKEMRETRVPTIESTAELIEYIDSLVNMRHDYGTCVYAMSMAAVAAYNYVASKLQVTGFQASCADLDIVSRNRNMGGRPFAIIDAEEMLYPQYDIPAKVNNMLKGWRPWAREQAVKLLSECSDENVSPNVRSRWEELAK